MSLTAFPVTWSYSFNTSDGKIPPGGIASARLYVWWKYTSEYLLSTASWNSSAGAYTRYDPWYVNGEPPAYVVYSYGDKVSYTPLPNPNITIPAFPLPVDNTNPQPGDGNTDEPINFICGNNHFPVHEIRVPTPGISLDFTRYYNSIATNSSVLGKGWRHSYNWSLIASSNQATVTADDARTYTFSKDSNGVYSASFDSNWQLSGLTNGEYTLLLPNAIAYRFDTNGVLQKISDNWSNAASLVYSNGLLSSVEHSSGQSLGFSYSNGLLSAVRAATNLSVSFAYDTNNVLIGIVRQVGTQSLAETCNYNESLLLTQRVDAVGSDYHYTYSSNNKATGMYLTDDHWYDHTVSYSGSTNRQVAYYRNGETLSHSYDVNLFINRVMEDRFTSITGKVTYAYDSGGNVVKKTTYAADTNRWTQVSRLYDDWHNVTNEAFGLSATPTNVTHYTWNTDWQVLTSVTDPEGFKREYEYTNGVIALSRITFSSNETAETTYSYATNGLLSVITNANGHGTSFTYDSLGYPQSVVPQAGPVRTLGYDSLGHLTNSALPGGRQTSYTVNPLGWVERIDHADGLSATFRYNGLGDVTNYVDRAGRNTDFRYLPGGKLTAVSRQLGSTNVTVSYDFDQQFNTLSIKDELGRPVESYALDALDRPTTVTNLEGQTLSIRYLVGDFVDSITRFDSTIVSNQYNGDGRLTAVYYPDETNQFAYLRNGFLQTARNSRGVISNAWNQAGWLTAVRSQGSGVSGTASMATYSYNAVGNITNTIVTFNNPTTNNLTTYYAYDEAERLTGVSQSGSGILPLAFSHTYNPDNGLVASVSNAVLSASYQYDVLDRVTSIDWLNSSGASILSFDYQYNAAGMITNIVKDDGSLLSIKGYQYDDLDRLICEDSGDSWAEYSYDAAGNRLTKTGSDYSVSYTNGAGNRLASWTAGSTNGFESFRILEVHGSSSEAIGTDERWGELWVSNSVAITPEFEGTNFWIDSFVTGLGTQTVVAAIRDQAGNVGYATNEIFLTVVTNGAYVYNSAGCLTNISYSGTEYSDSKSLGWNAQYQLTSVSSVYSVVNYSYDVLGRRDSRTDGTNTEHYIYNGNQVVADVDSNGNLLRSYVWGPGIDNLLALTVCTNGTTNTYYALKDHLNTVHALIDGSGTIIERYEYDAWGKILGVYDAGGAELTQSAIGNRYLWQGREYDFATGLYYFRARWYDPISARFVSKDPIGISGGLNQYVAFGNNGVNFVDPLGLIRASKNPTNLGTQELSQAALEQEYQAVYLRLQNTPKAAQYNPHHEASFDTRFWTGYNHDRMWKHQGAVYRGNEVNYIGIGMYEAWRGSSLENAKMKVKLWKGLMYFDQPNQAVMKWMEDGYNKYNELNKSEGCE
jgi:RHS repeat-associated protein